MVSRHLLKHGQHMKKHLKHGLTSKSPFSGHTLTTYTEAGYKWLPTDGSMQVLGFQVRKNGEGDPEFWQKQTAHMRKTLNMLNTRAASLRGRSLCVKAKLQSLVMYHARLCLPTKIEQETMDQIAWKGQMERESSTKAKQAGWLPSMASRWVQLFKKLNGQ